MSGWDEYDAAPGSDPDREPSEERGRAAWSDGGGGTTPPWASAQTQTGGGGPGVWPPAEVGGGTPSAPAGGSTPPPWASAPTQTGGTLPPAWVPPPPGSGHAPVPGPVPSGYPSPPGPAYAPHATPPYTTPAYAPPAPRRRVGRLLAAAALTVVVGVGAGAGTWYLVRDHGAGTGAGPVTSAGSVAVSASTAPSSPASSTPSDTATATPSASLLNSPSAGYRRTADPVGYSIDVPQGWSRREEQGKLAPVVYYDAPSDGRQLQIFEVTESTPYDSLTLAETDPGYGFAQQPGFQVVERDHGDTWAELSYRYDDKKKGTRQVIDHRFEAADGTLYAIRSSGPASLDPEQVRAPLRMAVRYFCPTGTECT